MLLCTLSILLLLILLLIKDEVSSKKNYKSKAMSKGISLNNHDNDNDNNDKSITHNKRNKTKAKNKNSKVIKRKVILPTPKQSLTSKAANSLSSITDVLKKSAESSLSLSNRIQRELKTYLSSDFEALLLRLTSPTDTIANEKDKETFISTIDTFVRNLDLKSDSNPYRVCLRKVWNKICESDGRTVLKSFFLLHNILRFTEPEDAVIFKSLILKMSKERCPKNRSKYFDTNVISLTPETKYLEDFISRYSSYVLKRSRAFTSSFEEVKLISHTMRVDDICASMMKSCKVLDAALACYPSPDEESEVVLSCLELVALDIRELFTLFYEKLKWIDKEEEVGDLFNTWEEAEVSAILTHLKSFYNDRYDDINKFLFELADILKLYKKKLKTKLTTPPFFKSIKDDLNNKDKDDEEFDADTIPKATSMQSDFGAITENESNTEIKNNNDDKDIFEDDNSNNNEIEDFRENKE